ncbi:MAG: 3-deoxy-D-manno-octulosonic acid transferase [Bacteroidetes bacterium]|nr:3-deoxy-D-manno-octulosonic acid transferase [Bacteroidota bacterium]
MRSLYTFGVLLYSRTIWLAGFWNKKAFEWWHGRKKEPWKDFDFTQGDWVWFHCASLGEFDQGIPLMESMKKKDVDLKIIVTFFSPSGMQHYKKRNAPVDFACYIPIDTKQKAKRFISKIQPKKVLFIKYEFWHNHIAFCAGKGIPVYSVCSIFRKNQVFFKFYGAFFRKTLKNIQYFFVQNAKSQSLLQSIGINKVKVVGDLRFDRVIANAKKANAHEHLLEFCSSTPVFIIGSSWPEDEAVLLPFINQLRTFKVIIAPHDISEKHIRQIEEKLERSAVRFTQFSSSNNKGEILILDTIGHLMNAYSISSVAYVGGGFKGSLHNILEPIAFRVPVLFGPKHTKFPEADLFKDSGIGFEIKTLEDLKISFENAITHGEEIKQKIDVFLLSQENVAEQILKSLDK